ncbi:MAG: hypothetical protein ACREDU_08065, partial [Methylocella sp.]
YKQTFHFSLSLFPMLIDAAPCFRAWRVGNMLDGVQKCLDPCISTISTKPAKLQSTIAPRRKSASRTVRFENAQYTKSLELSHLSMKRL